MQKAILTNQEQLSFGFGGQPNDGPTFEIQEIALPDAELRFYPHLFSLEKSDRIFDKLQSEIQWSQETAVVYGKRHNLPRLTAWYGDKGARYSYSRIANDPLPWTDLLEGIRQKVEDASSAKFNSVLLNFYRSGADAVGWHQDNESVLGKHPTIASVSFGQSRPFQMRHKFRKDLERKDILLTHGSLLLMKGATQEFWEHQIPKTAKPISTRINLTFRFINP
jgi:alkylated DNA repair dioxygenase AlkB